MTLKYSGMMERISVFFPSITNTSFMYAWPLHLSQCRSEWRVSHSFLKTDWDWLRLVYQLDSHIQCSFTHSYTNCWCFLCLWIYHRHFWSHSVAHGPKQLPSNIITTKVWNAFQLNIIFTLSFHSFSWLCISHCLHTPFPISSSVRRGLTSSTGHLIWSCISKSNLFLLLIKFSCHRQVQVHRQWKSLLFQLTYFHWLS